VFYSCDVDPSHYLAIPSRYLPCSLRFAVSFSQPFTVVCE
jgi:hypothetical protein